MNQAKQKNRLYFFFSLICVFLLSVCFIREFDGYNNEDARFANYNLLGSDSAGLAYYCDDDDSSKIAVAVGSCTAQDITVTTYNDKPVTEVFPAGFQNCSTIRTISLPDSITTFGTDAFAGSSLESITIPNGLTVISSGAFRNCKGLTAVTFQNGNAVTTINDYAFANDFNLTTFAFHKITHLTTIGREAFLYCLGLRSVIFPNGFTTLESYAFQDCKGLTTIYFPGSITSIGAYAFRGVGEDAKIYFSEDRATTAQDCSISDPNASTTIPFEDVQNFSFGDYYIPIIFGVGDLKIEAPFKFSRPENGVYPLNKCTNTDGNSWLDTGTTEYTETIAEDEVILWDYEDDGRSSVDIPATIYDGAYKVVGIRANAFAEKTAIESVTFHENLRFIDYKAFSECTSLKTVDLRGAVDLKHIQSRAFYNTMPMSAKNNSNLYSIHIPANVQNIGAEAFRYCQGLFKLYFDGATNEYEETFICENNKKTFELAFVPVSVTQVTVAGPATANYTLSGKTITLGSQPEQGRVIKVKYTTNSTTTQDFKGHKDGDNLVTDFVLSGKAEDIGSVTVGGEAKTLGTDYTTALNGNGTTTITFTNAPADGSAIVVSYRALSKLNKIDEYAFYGCADGLGDHTFHGVKLSANDDAYQKVYFPATLQNIGREAFSKSQFVAGAIFKSSTLTIASMAFYSVECLSSIVFPDSMTRLTLNYRCFASELTVANYAAGNQYKKLISVTLPANTTVNGNEIFYGHVFLAIYCINNAPTKYNTNTTWNKVGSKLVSTFGDFSSNATQTEMDYAPYYLVNSASDIVSLPSKEYPIFDFVKEKGSDSATLTKYHYYGGRIKDASGNTAIIPGTDLNTTDTSKKNPSYNSEYAYWLGNGHFRANIPAQVSFGGVLKNVTKIGHKALAAQMNTSTLNPKKDTAQGIDTSKDSYKYWQETLNFWTMREIVVPNSVQIIGDAAMAFVPFTTLKTYVLSDSEASSDNLSMIWDGGNTETEGKFPSGLTSIGKLAFTFSCITSASIPDSLAEFGGITSSAGPTDTSFFSFPFMGCFDLAELSMYASSGPSGVFSASGGVINYVSSNKMIEGAEGKTEITIPWGTQTTVAGALRGGRNIETVHFPYTMTAISDNFLDVIGSARDSKGRAQQGALTTITFESGSYYTSQNVSDSDKTTYNTSKCTTIGISAFWGCRDLVNVELPVGLTTLKEKAFKECNTVNNFSVDKGTSNTSPFTPIANEVMGSHFDCTKLPSLSSIGYECFMNDRAITQVTTSDKISTLNKGTFNGCSGVASINIDSATTSIGEECFKNCTAMTSATFNGTVGLVKNSFSGCSLLSTVTFGGATTFGETCFNGCKSLNNITIPEGSILNTKVFNGCTGLAAAGGGIIVEPSVRFNSTKDNSAFIGCKSGNNLAKIYLEEDKATYETERLKNNTRYPDGWNMYSYANNSGSPLPFYLYSADDPGTQSASPANGFWHYTGANNDIPTIW